MTARTFELPDLGEGLTEAEIVRWLVGTGDTVTVDQPVVEVETAKAMVEVPSPYAGTVSRLHGEAGEVVAVGAPLISIAGNAAPADADAERYREEERAGSGNVLIGYGTSAEPASGRRRRRPVAVNGGAVDGPAESGARHVRRVTSPLVRRLARDAGLVIGDLVGTGHDGLITRRDVEAAIAARHSAPAAAPRAALPVGPAETRTPMTGFRKAVAETLTRSRALIPEATVWVDVDFTELFALRARLKSAGRPVPGLLAYVARFTVAALRAHPELNGAVDDERQELVQYRDVNLGLAMQTDRGLVVPAVMGAREMTTAHLDTEIRRLTTAAREGRTTREELTAGTFTLNNYGSFDVDGSAAIINHPQVAILGLGRVIDRPWAVGGDLAVRKIGQLSFVFDHRVCDGGTAAAFLRMVADSIECPGAALTDL
ncbi:pyruvate dehydrogenase E2 component (dihydrolipoamide acetyltransferase) [Actinomadura pelletieri DSM 43383]|uniref:Dihydrolipoamide acetyltransferase component of pyruvate dehydrogenase complex n=1 Tax=Actinomadura pelletieri DSM 43383 TaxID=1120940 RepID=A0A495QKX4_9ACTN|nr:dihydrolipoamide acetyltransferase family protein [Actinomadura pelletieri]RKS73146.1 pyruvate dehydrogenase E2 component (dihydrolipoamide acetyltransferase) [Actinomadura pelletieri DSM 43383]